MKSVFQAGYIVVLSAVLAAISFALRHDAVPLEKSGHEIDLAAALALDEALWVDARVQSDYEAGHYPGSIALNMEDWETGFVGLLGRWLPDSPIVVYCSSSLACVPTKWRLA